MNSAYKRTIIIAILLAGILSWIYIAFRIYRFNIHTYISSSQYHLTLHRHQPASIADIHYISSWMTFDYITKVFHLPPLYLKQTLNVKASNYPFITLQQYAKQEHLNVLTLTRNTQNSVKQFLASSTPQ